MKEKTETPVEKHTIPWVPIIGLGLISVLLSVSVLLMQIKKYPKDLVGRIEQVTPDHMIVSNQRGRLVSVDISGIDTDSNNMPELHTDNFVRISGHRAEGDFNMFIAESLSVVHKKRK